LHFHELQINRRLCIGQAGGLRSLLRSFGKLQSLCLRYTIPNILGLLNTCQAYRWPTHSLFLVDVSRNTQCCRWITCPQV